ncbi:hypothetical protein ON010_g5855 [Phytophthora cinnamomi]|nr:hypothetical protein ON010_g5855 [Phytophthora cinnamomi]
MQRRIAPWACYHACRQGNHRLLAEPSVGLERIGDPTAVKLDCEGVRARSVHVSCPAGPKRMRADISRILTCARSRSLDSFCHVGVGLAQQALEVEDGVLGVRRQLVDGRVAHDHLLALEAHEGGRGAEALVVGDDVHLAVVPHAHAAVRRADVDACDHHVACVPSALLGTDLSVERVARCPLARTRANHWPAALIGLFQI